MPTFRRSLPVVLLAQFAVLALMSSTMFAQGQALPPVSRALRPDLDREPAAAVARYHLLRRDSSAAYDFAERHLNTLGYTLVSEGKLAAALAVLDLNRSEFPASANAQDSFGEVALLARDTTAAIAAYRRALQLLGLNPGTDALRRSALGILAELEAARDIPHAVGVYVGDQGRKLIIGRVDRRTTGDAGIPLGYLDTERGDFGYLVPIGDGKYEARRGVITDGRTIALVTLSRVAGGRYDVTWMGSDGQRWSAKQSGGVRQQELSIDRSGWQLAARLTEPTVGARHPAVVFIHGSGTGGRAYLTHELMALWLAEHGIASLTYDKRGYDASSGPRWQNASIRDLATDASAALRMLRTLPQIDPQRVGLLGRSQGGWIAPLVASRDSAAFMALIGGPSGTSWDQEVDRVRETLRALGFAPGEVERGVAATRLFFRFADGAPVADSLRETARALRGTPLGARVRVEPDSQVAAGWRRGRYDPTDAIRQLRLPILLQFGSEDLLVPPSVHAPRWEALLAQGGVRPTTILYAGGDHALWRHSPKAADVGVAVDSGCMLLQPLVDLAVWISQVTGTPRTLPPLGTPCAERASVSSPPVASARNSNAHSIVRTLSRIEE